MSNIFSNTFTDRLDSSILQILRNGILGAGAAAVGALGWHVVCCIKDGTSKAANSSNGLFKTLGIVMMISLPLWHLYKNFQKNNHSTIPDYLKGRAFEIITIGATALVVHLQQQALIVQTCLGLIFIHLAWRTIADTKTGQQMLGV